MNEWETVEIEKVKYQHHRVFGENLEKNEDFPCFPHEEDLRLILRGAGNNRKANPRGGKTVCTLITDEGVMAQGVSHCSYSDIFRYDVGRQRSYAKAIESLSVKLAEIGISG